MHYCTPKYIKKEVWYVATCFDIFDETVKSDM